VRGGLLVDGDGVMEGGGDRLIQPNGAHEGGVVDAESGIK
jgi:hypothetical protein